MAKAGIVTVWANGNDGGDGSADLSNPPGQDPTPGVISVAAYDDLGTGTSASWLWTKFGRHPPANVVGRKRPNAPLPRGSMAFQDRLVSFVS